MTVIEKPPPYRVWAMLPPWIVLGIVVILAPLLVYSTLDRIEKQRELTTRLLLEKGEALIQALEAGVRTGMGMQWGGFQMQKLLMEMARQPDIDYLVVTNQDGVILADSEPSLLGETYGTDLDLARVARSREPAWRQVAHPDGIDTFEVYRPLRTLPGMSPFPGFHSWIVPPAGEAPAGTDAALLVFVGIHMGAVEEARQAEKRHALWVAGILLLAGMAGILFLLLAQGYRAVKTSLHQVQAFSDTIVAHMPIGLVALDRQGRIAALNATAAALLGRKEEEILRRPQEEVLPAPLQDLAPGPHEKGVRLVGPDGRRKFLEAIAMTVPGAEEGPDRVLLFRDVTDLEGLREEVEKNRRLAAVGNLAAGVAHEIRNPLSSLKGFATYFRQRYGDMAEDRQAAEIMVQEVDRLNRVVGQLLDFARPQVPAKREVALETIVAESLALVAGEAAKRGIAVQSDLQGGLRATVDPDQLRQVFLNLYLNALASMEEGGTLDVRLRRDPTGAARIAIADTGAGIAPEDLSRVFDPYFTTKPSGTGLGLPVAQKIVEAHGGRIVLESAPGQGTTATVVLPGNGP